MSYDIRFAVKVEGATDVFAVIGQPELRNPTYNLREMFVACMGWDYDQGKWYRLEEVLPKIIHGISELKHRPGEYQKYVPANGWGTLDGAKMCLSSICEWADDKGWNNNVPIECIYMAW